MFSMHRATGAWSAALPSLLLPALVLAGGCTMCPDPFDYSGPVPNGSVTQNDFAARSNGTRPVRSTPFPWPPLVDTGRRPTPADDPDPTMLVAAESPAGGDAMAEEAVAVAAETPVASEAAPAVAEAPSTSVAFVPDDAPVPAPVKVAPGVVPPRGAWMTRDRRLPPPGNVVPPAERQPASSAPETSGWRAAARSAIGR